jgi:hypothetical protein
MIREPSREKDEREVKEDETRTSKQGKESEAERFKGLCMNCDNRFECRLPRPEGGVWHCEEYR